jgi:hypothetical protein
MNVLKNFEAVFAVALGVAVSAATFSGPSEAVAPAAPIIDSSVATPTKMAVVSVPAKRMSAIQKQRSLEDEGLLAKQDAPRNSI